MLFKKDGIRFFVFNENIDMRAGFEKLHGLCVGHMKANMNEGNAYLFFGKNRKRVKILIYDGSGLVLIAKRLERNRFMKLEDLMGRSEISLSELELIFHGGVSRSPIFGKEADDLNEVTVEKMILQSQIKNTTQREGFALISGAMNAHP